MSIKTVTSFRTLMKLAYELGQAHLSGDKERIARAVMNHDSYRDLCLQSDEMALNAIYGELYVR